MPSLDLTRFRGYLTLWEGGIHDVEITKPLCAGIPATDDRAGSRRAQPEELAREFEPSAQTIRNWAAQVDRDESRRSDGLTTEEREELRRLRRDNRRLREEREILAKATAWFARETDSRKSSSS